jgi:hypothetical protein
MIPGLKKNLLTFALRLRKTSARRPSDKGSVLPVIASNRIPYLQMRSTAPLSTSGREKEEKKERTVEEEPPVSFLHSL